MQLISQHVIAEDKRESRRKGKRGDGYMESDSEHHVIRTLVVVAYVSYATRAKDPLEIQEWTDITMVIRFIFIFSFLPSLE